MARKASFAVALDTLVTLWAPPDSSDVAEQNGYGEVDRTESNWTAKGRCWVNLGSQSNAQSTVGNQAGDSASYAIDMNARADFALDWRMKIETGPLAGYFLYPSAISQDKARSRRVVVSCTLSWQV